MCVRLLVQFVNASGESKLQLYYLELKNEGIT